MAATSWQRDWATLPCDLVVDISARLLLPNYYRFRAVCKSWCSTLPSAPPKSSPWLMLSHSDSVAADELTFLSLTDQRPYRLPPLATNIRVVGSHDGCLIVVDDEIPQVFLLNPTNGARCVPSSFKDHFAEDIHKIAVSPCLSFTVSIFREQPKEIFYSEDGGGWSYQNLGDAIDDVIFHNGKFFAISSSECDIWALDHALASWSFRRCSLYLPDDYDDHRSRENVTVYLISSSASGDLLLVNVFMNSPADEIVSLEILKLDEANERWEEMKDLGDQCLFVSRKHSVSIDTRDVPDLERNCVYLAYDDPYVQDSANLACFDVGRQVIEPYLPSKFPPGCNHLRAAPLWFVPRFHGGRAINDEVVEMNMKEELSSCRSPERRRLLGTRHSPQLHFCVDSIVLLQRCTFYFLLLLF